MNLLVKYILVGFGAFGLWSAHRATGEPVGAATNAERAVGQMWHRMAYITAWATLLAGVLQVVSGYQSPFDFLAAPLGVPVLTAWCLLLSAVVYWWAWLCFIATADEVRLVTPNALRGISGPIFKTVATIGGGLAVSLVVVLWRSPSDLASEPSPTALPVTAVELISAGIGATFVFGGMLAQMFREEALVNLAGPATDRKKAGNLLRARSELFTPQGWRAMQRARFFSLMVLASWLTLAAVAVLRS